MFMLFLKCTKCGGIVERTLVTKVVRCFSCKVQYVRKYGLQRRLKK